MEPIPEHMLNRICALVGPMPRVVGGVKITRELIKVTVELLNAEKNKTLPQNSRKEIFEHTPDGLDRRIKEIMQDNQMKAPFISSVLEEVGIVDIVKIKSSNSGRNIKGTRLKEEWSW